MLRVIIRHFFFLSVLSFSVVILQGCWDDMCCKSKEDNLIWVQISAGIQCEPDSIKSQAYYEIKLQNNGVLIEQSNQVDHIVPTVCGAPTSLHFQFQISQGHLQKAQTLGFSTAK